jgi:O-antigen ligase
MTVRRARAAELSTALLLCSALVFGGASQGNALALGAAELLALPAFGIGLWTVRPTLRRPGSRLALGILAAVILIPCLQLIPLSAAVWSRLPGRAGVVEVLRTAGIPIGAMPLSLTPRTTLHCLLALIPPAAALLIAPSLHAAARGRLVIVILWTALTAVLLGILQITRGPDSVLYFYADTNNGSAVGFFSNRNHMADFLACAIPLSAAALAARWRAATHLPSLSDTAILALVAIVILGVAVTGSRAGIILCLAGLLGALAILWPARIASERVRAGPRAALVLALLATAVVVAALALGDVPALARFGEGADTRFEAAPVVFKAVKTFWPVGSGVGSFIPIYQTFQPTRLVDPSFFNHAHDDFLEVPLETGLAGVLVFAAFLVWFARRFRSAWSTTDAPKTRALPRAGSLVAVMILLHSTVDYPLRTVALATLFAFACGLMIAPPVLDQETGAGAFSVSSSRARSSRQ